MPTGKTERKVTRTALCRSARCSNVFTRTQSAIERPTKYCSEACRNDETLRRARIRWAANKASKPCRHCQEPFVPPSSGKWMYCSEDCKNVGQRQQRQEERDRIRKKKTPRICRYQQCMKWFVPSTKGPQNLYCTDDCRRKQLSVYTRMRTYCLDEQTVLRCMQQAFCDLCGLPFQSGQSQHIDHDHKTGNYRGVLHRECNTALGLLQDDPGRAMQAADYLLGKRSWGTIR
jgi:hypothetical protein